MQLRRKTSHCSCCTMHVSRVWRKLSGVKTGQHQLLGCACRCTPCPPTDAARRSAPRPTATAAERVSRWRCSCLWRRQGLLAATWSRWWQARCSPREYLAFMCFIHGKHAWLLQCRTVCNIGCTFFLTHLTLLLPCRLCRQPGRPLQWPDRAARPLAAGPRGSCYGRGGHGNASLRGDPWHW